MADKDLMVSVAVITYNMERYLRPLLDSILKQKVSFPYEIVIATIVLRIIPGKSFGSTRRNTRKSCIPFSAITMWAEAGTCTE